MRRASRFQWARWPNVSRSNVAAELAVDADEEVAVERRRDPERVVVGEQQIGLGLDEVGAEQQQVAGIESGANAIEKPRRRRRIEVADVRTEEQDQRGAAFGPRRHRGAQPFFVRRPVADDRHVPQAVQALLGLLQRLRRDVDQVDARAAAAPLERFRQQHQLLAAAAAELDDRPLVRRRRAATIAAAWRASSRISPRVMRYHGSRQIASNRLEPSAS